MFLRIILPLFFSFFVYNNFYANPPLQSQYEGNKGIDVCPGPFEVPLGTDESIKKYFADNPMCHRTSIGLQEPYNSEMVKKSLHSDGYSGPNWNDYREVYKNWDCGALYNDAARKYVCGGGSSKSFRDSPYPNGPQKSNGNTPPGCQLTGCDPPASDNLWYCNPVGYGAASEGGCFCPFGGVDNPRGNPAIKNPGCYVEPKFNWIIGACQGSSCNGVYEDVYDGDGKLLVNTTGVREYKNIGSQLLINYVAAFNYDKESAEWVMAADSSFNVNGEKPAYDAMKAYGGMNKSDAWLVPQVGGSVQWGWGFHPIGAEGLGPLALGGQSGGMMFVLSTESSFNFAWYMLNQVNLDRGAGGPACDYGGKTYPNCWNSGNSGEIDFLESPFAANKGFVNNYTRMYLNNINQFGRCFPSMAGALSGGWGGNWERSTMMTGTNPMGKAKPYIYVAVVDKVGVWVYRMPGDENIWQGISRKTIMTRLQNVPDKPPKDFQPCGDDKNDYCMMFIPNCEATNAKEANLMSCAYTDNQGFCENWFQLLENTGQWKWNGTDWNILLMDPYVSNGGIKLSWEKAMAPYQCHNAYDDTC